MSNISFNSLQPGRTEHSADGPGETALQGPRARGPLSLSRRTALGTAAALLASPALAQPASIHDHLPWIPKMREDLGESRRVLKERVVLDIAPLVDNGNVVPMSVSVQSAMQGSDRVKSVRIYSEKNPQPRVVAFHFSEFSPEAKAATRIRLNGSQKLVAIAEMQDGTLYAGVTEVVVTVSACIDGT
jgi:sulfur-oxidizing protein SoxY